MDESGLAEVHPELRIRFSRPVGYIELLETVQLHGYHLMRRRGRVLLRAEIARSWYETVYEPTIDVIRSGGARRGLSRGNRPGPLPLGLGPPARADAGARLPAARRDRTRGDAELARGRGRAAGLASSFG